MQVCRSNTVRALEHLPDQELLRLLQSQPQDGRYFVGLFCRYQALVTQVIRQYLTTPTAYRHYLNQMWLHIYRLWRSTPLAVLTAQPLDHWLKQHLPTWLLELPPIKNLGRSASLASVALPPPLWCYLMLALESLPGDLRFVLVLSDMFQWLPRQISEQLANEGYTVSPADTEHLLRRARHSFWQALPGDLQPLYLSGVS